MNPLVLLGAAVAFLAFSGQSNPPTPNGKAIQPGTPEDSDPLAPTFNNVPLPEKTKPGVSPVSLTAADDPSQVVGISPPADCSMPPYVWLCGTPELSTFGAMDSATERGSASPVDAAPLME